MRQLGGRGRRWRERERGRVWLTDRNICFEMRQLRWLVGGLFFGWRKGNALVSN